MSTSGGETSSPASDARTRNVVDGINEVGNSEGNSPRGATSEQPAVDAPNGSGAPHENVQGPVDRHQGWKVNQKSVPKDNNTVYGRDVNVRGDVEGIRAGQAVEGRTPDGVRTYEINGRTYGAHENGRLYPMKGEGLHELNRAQYKALGVYNQHGTGERAEQILNNMKTTPADRAAAQSAYRSIQEAEKAHAAAAGTQQRPAGTPADTPDAPTGPRPATPTETPTTAAPDAPTAPAGAPEGTAAPDTPNAPRSPSRLGTVLEKGGGALAVAGGAYQAYNGVQALRNGDTLNGVTDTAGGGLNIAGGAALLAGGTAATVAAPIALGGAAILDGGRNMIHGYQTGNREEMAVGGAKTLGGTLMAAGGVAAATGLGAPIGAGLALAGGVVYAGAAIYENREAIGNAISNAASAVSNTVSNAASNAVSSVGSWLRSWW